jgi:hypothetical protein
MSKPLFYMFIPMIYTMYGVKFIAVKCSISTLRPKVNMWLSFVIKRCFVGVFFSVDWNMKLNSIITITHLLGCIHVTFLGMWNCVVDRQFSNLLMVMLLWVQDHEFYFFPKLCWQTYLYLLLFSSFSPFSCVFLYSSHMFSISHISSRFSHYNKFAIYPRTYLVTVNKSVGICTANPWV